MSEKNQTHPTRLPARGARIIAAVCALMMTACLFLSGIGLAGIQVMTSRSLHERAALATDVVDRQMARIESDVTGIAAEYGFRPETLLALITRESAENLDREIIAWWTGIGSTGKAAEMPSYTLAKAEEALQKDEEFMAGLDPTMVRNTIESIQSEVQDAVWKSAAQFRELLVGTGIRMAGDRVNLAQITELLSKIPVACGLGGLLAAGLIALTMSRRIQTAGQYIGGAMSAAGLLWLLGLLGIRLMGIRGMIAEASAALEAQYIHLARMVSLEVIGGAALMMALGGLLMALAGKEYRKA